MNLHTDEFRDIDKRDIDELTHRSVHRLQITGVQMNLLTGQFT
jgi:hypothetical protein